MQKWYQKLAKSINRLTYSKLEFDSFDRQLWNVYNVLKGFLIAIETGLILQATKQSKSKRSAEMVPRVALLV